MEENVINIIEDKPICVYVKINEEGFISDVNSDIFIKDFSGWVKIDEGFGDKFAHAQSQYFDIPIIDENGNYRSTYEILRDISLVYQEILEADKKAGTNRGQALLEVLAGKNRSNVAASILQSPELLTSVYEETLAKSQGKTVEHSLKLYEEYITNKVDVVDVATYGKYLVTSSSRANAKSFTNSGTSTLVKVVSDDSPNFNEPNLTYTLTNKLDSQIDLFTLEEGDYIICKDFDVTKPNIRDVYHYTGEEMFIETTNFPIFDDKANSRYKL